MLLRDVICICLTVICLGCGQAAAFIDTYHSLNSSDWANIDRIVTRAVQCRNVTGLNIAVINNGNTFYRSYGYADYANTVPLRPETRICIGSTGKAFTTALVSILLSENKTRYPLKWDTPLKDIFGNDFQLSDAYRTEHATLSDLAAHKMGWRQYNYPSVVGRDTSHSRLEYCRRLRYLNASAGFRERFLYSNDGYMLLGCAAEVMASENFNVVMRRKLLNPLNMNDTVAFFNIDDWDSGQESKLHFSLPSGIVVGPPAILDAGTDILPAGGYCSDSDDMAKWMHFQQTFRTARGESLADDDILSEMHDSQIAVPPYGSFQPLPQMPLTDVAQGYGFGWFVGYYRGYRNVQHGGVEQASMSLVRVFKDVNLAMTGMANIRSRHVMRALELTQYYIADLALGITPWVTESLICSYPLPTYSGGGGGMPPALKGFVPSRDLVVCSANSTSPPCQSKDVQQDEVPEWARVFIGNYGHPLWANFTVNFNRSTGYLTSTSGNDYLGRGVLHPTYNESVFLLQPRYPAAPLLLVSDPNQLSFPVYFSSVKNGMYRNLLIPMFIDGITPATFQRGLEWNGGGELLAEQSDVTSDVARSVPFGQLGRPV